MIQFPQSTNGHARSMSNEFKRHVPESTLRKYRENGKLPALKNGPEDFPVWLLAMAAIRGGLSARTVRAALDAITHIATDRARVGNDEFDRRWRQYLEDVGAETADPFSVISLFEQWDKEDAEHDEASRARRLARWREAIKSAPRRAGA